MFKRPSFVLARSLRHRIPLRAAHHRRFSSKQDDFDRSYHIDDQFMNQNIPRSRILFASSRWRIAFSRIKSQRSSQLYPVIDADNYQGPLTRRFVGHNIRSKNIIDIRINRKFSNIDALNEKVTAHYKNKFSRVRGGREALFAHEPSQNILVMYRDAGNLSDRTPWQWVIPSNLIPLKSRPWNLFSIAAHHHHSKHNKLFLTIIALYGIYSALVSYNEFQRKSTSKFVDNVLLGDGLASYIPDLFNFTLNSPPNPYTARKTSAGSFQQLYHSVGDLSELVEFCKESPKSPNYLNSEIWPNKNTEHMISQLFDHGFLYCAALSNHFITQPLTPNSRTLLDFHRLNSTMGPWGAEFRHFLSTHLGITSISPDTVPTLTVSDLYREYTTADLSANDPKTISKLPLLSALKAVLPKIDSIHPEHYDNYLIKNALSLLILRTNIEQLLYYSHYNFNQTRRDPDSDESFLSRLKYNLFGIVTSHGHNPKILNDDHYSYLFKDHAESIKHLFKQSNSMSNDQLYGALVDLYQHVPIPKIPKPVPQSPDVNNAVDNNIPYPLFTLPLLGAIFNTKSVLYDTFIEKQRLFFETIKESTPEEERDGNVREMLANPNIIHEVSIYQNSFNSDILSLYPPAKSLFGKPGTAHNEDRDQLDPILLSMTQMLIFIDLSFGQLLKEYYRVNSSRPGLNHTQLLSLFQRQANNQNDVSFADHLLIPTPLSLSPSQQFQSQPILSQQQQRQPTEQIQPLPLVQSSQLQQSYHYFPIDDHHYHLYAVEHLPQQLALQEHLELVQPEQV